MSNLLLVIFGVLVTCFQVGEARAVDLKLLTTNGMRAVLNQIGPQFERDTGHKLNVEFGAGPVLRKRIEAGDAFDVVILPIDIGQLVQQGRIVAATRTVLGRTGYGAAVRKGAAKPDIGTTEALRRTLLDSRSVAFTAEGASGTYVLNMIKRLGIAEEMKTKLKPTKGGGDTGPVAAVASGEADIVVAGIAVILGGVGVELMGWLPHEVQSYFVFTAGVSGSARDMNAASALIRSLTTPAAVAVFKSAGIEPIAP
jgi:molybdate transport system substrate-binding protein